MIWLKASYHFHTYCYRDPRSVYASGVGVPVVSPTTIFLGIASTLFRFGKSEEAQVFLSNIESFQLAVDSPDGIIFFRAFHQVRRYHSGKWGANPKVGLTLINQATKEYGLTQGEMSVFLGIPEDFKTSVRFALENLTHLGTRDSLCSLNRPVEVVNKPLNVLYQPAHEMSPDEVLTHLKSGRPVTMVTLSTFYQNPQPAVKSSNWFMSGEKGETKLVSFVVSGTYSGTTYGKIYKKK